MSWAEAKTILHDMTGGLITANGTITGWPMTEETTCLEVTNPCGGYVENVYIDGLKFYDSSSQNTVHIYYNFYVDNELFLRMKYRSYPSYTGLIEVHLDKTEKLYNYDKEYGTQLNIYSSSTTDMNNVNANKVFLYQLDSPITFEHSFKITLERDNGERFQMMASSHGGKVNITYHPFKI